jgi:5-methylcytosine-specific restriction protein A
MATYGRACRWPGCAAIVEFGIRPGFCPEHRGPADRARGSAADRGYDRRWHDLSRAYLARHPWCVWCLAEGRQTPATDTDHIRARRDGGTDAWGNLRALCGTCHRRRTALDQSGWSRR